MLPKILDGNSRKFSRLKNGLVAYYRGDEPSGDLKSHNAKNNMTATNAPGTASGLGMMPSSRSFVTNKYFVINDNADISLGNVPFTLSCWVYANTLGHDIWDKVNADGAANNRAWELTMAANPQFSIWDGVPAGESLTYDLGTCLVNTWYLLSVWVHPNSSTWGIRVNNWKPKVAVKTKVMVDDAFKMTIGALIDSVSAVIDPFNGNGMGFAYWKRKLELWEIDLYYNNGVPRYII